MANRDLTKRYAIKRSPTVKIFGTDKQAPEDYTGKRRADDLVIRVDEYASENEFVVPPPPSKFDYNIDAVVKTISIAHKYRINVAQTSHN